ncbi:hypothetical protein [Klebsiella pneumoniae]|uniref:hypothetical protein n=1 Tax=Klebsiella pneumoniae TaxID=573 RepID=UPI000F1D98BE|nr:hypothetical protein BANRA_05214 [Klebsiella pneumoniae]
MVWRRLRIAADTSLAALHFIFQIVQGWGGTTISINFTFMAKITVSPTKEASVLSIIRSGS